jgi:hypothetical protein
MVHQNYDAGEIRSDGGPGFLADTTSFSEFVQFGKLFHHLRVIVAGRWFLCHEFQQCGDLIVELHFDLIALEHG